MTFPVRTDLPCSIERLREMFDYDPATGVFVRKLRGGRNGNGRARDRRPAGRLKAHGYVQIAIFGREIYAHRLAWAYVHGFLPAAEIDHADCNRSNNAIANLRLATRAQQCANCGAKRSKYTTLKGAHFCSKTGKWRAHIKVDYKQRFLGSFATAEEAHAVYVRAATNVFADYARAA